MQRKDYELLGQLLARTLKDFQATPAESRTAVAVWSLTLAACYDNFDSQAFINHTMSCLSNRTTNPTKKEN